MAYVTNAQAIRFCDERIRPLAERMARLNVMLDETIAEYFQLQSYFGNADDSVADHREAQGVSRITAGDVVNLITQALTIQAQFDGAGVMDVIRKPTVRKIDVD